MDNLLHYIAGWFDGEGCLGIYKRGTRGAITVMAKANSTYKPSIDLLSQTFGGHTRTTNPRSAPNGEGRKTVYEWSCSDKRAVEFVHTMYPFLREKKAQAKLVLDFAIWRAEQPRQGVNWKEAMPLVKQIADLKRKEYS